MITVLQIVFFCLLLSAFFFTGIITILITGIFNLGEIISVFPQQIQGLILAAVFLILFSLIFFYVNVRQYFVEREREKEENISDSIESIDFAADEVEVVEEEEVSGLVESIDLAVDEIEVVEKEDISCSPESIDLAVDEVEVVEEDNISCSPESVDLAADETETAEVEVVEVEDISAGYGGNVSMIMGRLFTFSPGNPELLQAVENSTTGISGKVIYERNGIHYINSDAFTGDGNTEREINNDFAQLVESVVNKA